MRPTTDFAREALFNILDNRLDYERISALDLFGGTGIHSIELASRGCIDITFVDRFKDSVIFMKKLSKEMDLPIQSFQADVFSFVKNAGRKWDYIFADPPYDMSGLEEIPSLILGSGIIADGGFFVLEHSSKKNLLHIPAFKESRKYGQTVFSFYAPGS